MVRTALVAAVASLTLGACAGMTQTERGAATGAGVGAVAGAVIGRDTGSAAVGAVVGGLAGAYLGCVNEGRCGGDVDRRQHYDQRSGRYYFQDPRSGQYFYENGEPYP